MHRFAVRSEWAIVGVLTAACAVVPVLYRSRLSDVFAAPKLAGLWATFVVCNVLVGVIAAVGDLSGLRPKGSRTTSVALLAWIGLNVAAFTFSVDRHQSLFGERYWYQGLLTVLLYGGLFCIARLVFTTDPRLWCLLAGIAGGGTVVALVGLLQHAGRDPVFGGAPASGRVFSTIGQPNSLAAYLVMTSICALALATRPRLVVRIPALLASIAMIWCLILTDSRGGYLGIVVVLVTAVSVGAWVGRVDPKRATLRALALVAVAVMVVLLVSPARSRLDRAWERLVSVSDTDDPSVTTHSDLWSIAWRISLDHPVIGTGQETFPIVAPGYLQQLPEPRATALSRYRLESPHDGFLAIAAGTGLPALAAYLVLVGSVVVGCVGSARRSRSTARRILLVTVVAAVAGHVVTAAFMTADLSASALSWILLGAGACLACSTVPPPDVAASTGPTSG